MIGAEFTGVLHAAQQGRVSAFERLWADLHPGLIRYLRVVAVADADDIACESWVDVVRRLPSFEGDETAWRAEVFGAARLHAEDENQRRVWDAMAEDVHVAAVLAEPLPVGDEPFEGDEVEGGPAQGLRLALEAIRDLPPEQGDVLMLRRVAELPEDAVAALVGSDAATVHAWEQQALDRLGLDAELLSWALAAEPRPVELADESTVVGFFRAVVPEQPAAGSLALRTRARAGAEAAAATAVATTASTSSSTSAGTASARVITLGKPTWRARAGAVAAVSAGVIGLGAISAAAYQGALPDPVQNVMHVVIGAPEPTPEAAQSSASKKSHKAKAGTRATTPAMVGPVPATAATSGRLPGPSAAGLGLCNAWAAQLARPGAPAQASSPVFTSLAKLAGGPDQVVLFCALNNVSLPAAQAATSAPPTTTATPPETPKPQVTSTSKAPQNAKPEPSKPPASKPQPSKPPASKPVTATPPPTTTTPAPPTTTVVPPTATTNGGGPPAGAGTGGGNGNATGAKATGAAKEPAAGRARANAKGASAAAAANDQE